MLWRDRLVDVAWSVMHGVSSRQGTLSQMIVGLCSMSEPTSTKKASTIEHRNERDELLSIDTSHSPLFCKSTGQQIFGQLDIPQICRTVVTAPGRVFIEGSTGCWVEKMCATRF